MDTATLTHTARRILLAAAVAAGATFAADAAEADGISCKVTGVAVLDESQGDRAKVKYLPPDTRVVVPSARHFVLFRVEYDIPTNMNARIFLGENGNTARLGLDFRTGASALYKGTGTVAKPLGLDSDVYDKGVLLKSVRLSAEIEGNDGEEAKSVFVGDATVNVLFAKDGGKKTDGFTVLEPLPPPPATSTSLLPGWTEDFKAAKARAAKEGKLVLAYFLLSRPRKDGKAMKVLDHKVLGSEEFLKRAGESYVCYMAELHKPSQSWMAQNNVLLAFKYAAQNRTITPPKVAIIHPDGSRLALLDSKGWEDGVDGYLAKIEKGRRASVAKHEREEKAREAAARKIPPKTDATSTPAGFTDNIDDALAKAKAEGKLVYACFSGSDWCYWCKKLEEEVLSDPLFVAGVMDDYVLVFIDSPENKALLSDHAKAENEKLTKKYGIRGFPTALILDGDGKKVGETGYRQGGAAEYVKHLKSFRKK